MPQIAVSQPEYEALVVENELDFRSELIYFIESLDIGISVVAEASSFDDAKQRLGRGDIDLLITDINLTDSPRFSVGDRDGLALAAYAKDAFDIPAVFLTAFADFDPAVFNLAAACEPVGFIQKNGEQVDAQTRDHMVLAVRRLESIRRERETARQLADVGELVGNAKLYIDDAGLVYDFDEAACALLERTPEELENHHWEDVIALSPRAPEDSHPLRAAFAGKQQVYLPSIAIKLPEGGLFLGSALITATEHLRRKCKLLLLRDLGQTTRDPQNWELSDGNCLIFIGITLSLGKNGGDLSVDFRTMMLELQSGVLARFPSSVTVSILQPQTLAVILKNTTEAVGHNVISPFVVEMESILERRHSGLKLHAGVVGAQHDMSVKKMFLHGLSALEDAQLHPTKRVQSARKVMLAS